MSLRLIDINVVEKHIHPTLQGRVSGVVRAAVSDDLGGRVHTHELTIKVKILAGARMNADDVDLALMVRAGEIIKRVREKYDAGPERDRKAAE